MRILVGVELLKLRTARGSWLLLIAAQAIVVAGISGLVVSGSDLHQPANMRTAIAHVGLASLCALVLGIVTVAGEYRHRTITDTYLSTPRRGRTLFAKLAVSATAGLALGVASSFTALVTAVVWWRAKGVTFDLGDAGVWQTVAGGIAWNAAFAAIGVGIGALVRNLAGAIAVALAWIALVEGIVGQLLGTGLSRWLPFNAGGALGRVGLGTDRLPQWGAGVLLAGYAAALAMIALWTTVRRDVS